MKTGGSILLALGIILCSIPAEAIILKGSNGREVDFHAVLSATPGGLKVSMTADSAPIEISWDKLDLATLAQQHPEIHAAYLRAKNGETVDLADGKGEVAKSDAMKEGAPTPEKPEEMKAPPQSEFSEMYPGWIDTNVGNLSFMMQAPTGKIRGVLLISLDDFGRSFRYLAHHERGTGYWGVFQTKFGMALMTYDAHISQRDPTKAEDFLFPEKGSGKAVFTALSSFASKLKQPDLANAPIAIYGSERSGAAFAYNFAQQNADRVIAVALYDGGFYDAEPTDASVKIPMLLMWGQYSSRPEQWHTENHTVSVLEKVKNRQTNWTNGREFRGKGENSEVVEFFAKQYLLSMVEARLPKEAAAEGGSVKLLPLNRGNGSFGNVRTGEVAKIPNAEANPGEDETFLPNQTIIRYWKDFVIGNLIPTN